MTPYERLLLPENLYYAWRKAKRLYRMADGYINQGELLEFELDLENRLQKIERKFKNGRYKLHPIRPVPRPKKLKDGKCVDRQYFHIAVDDQVAWIAIVNALGPELDDKMPAWSYGNRLYRAAWYEEEHQESKLEIGPYRHASGHLYKKFQHSWPLFRKHISLTARTMASPITKTEESEPDQRAIEAASKVGLPYLDNDFWNRPKNNGTDLYYASIDLKQFYPSIHAKKILAGLLLAQNASDPDGKLETLLRSMLKFTLDKSDISAPALGNVEPAFKGKSVKGLPTGLFAAGFLANAAMLSVDKIVDEGIQTDKTVAHFRFVDDHTILTYEFDKLCVWIEWYKKLVVKQLGIKVNEDKSDPESLSDWLKISKTMINNSRGKKKKEAKESKAKADSKIDGSNPTKLLTKTLEKVSIIAGQNTNILDDHDLKDRLKDLEWLLLADIPEREIRPDTRAAFAAGQIATLAPMLIQEADGIVDTHRELVKMERDLQILGKYPEQNGEKIQALTKQYKNQLERFNEQKKKLDYEEKGHLTRCFGLLIHAMKEHPSKARIFFRLHQYCLLTGHHGLMQIIEWIDGLSSVWADYYRSLTLQILAQNILKAIRVCTTPASLRSDQEAASKYLDDIASIEQKRFNANGANESWFHKMARREYTVSVAIAVEYLKQSGLESLSSKFAEVAKFHGAPALEDNSSIWFEKTGYSAGNWAYLAEHHLRTDSNHTGLWEIFGRGFDYGKVSDQRAIRLYPDVFPKKAWEYLVSSRSTSREDDSGWIYDILKNKRDWIKETKRVRKTAFMRAVRVLEAESKTHVSIAEWTKYINSDDCSPFDPRKSEWTALEIIRQVVEPKLEVGAAPVPLERIHPHNILIPQEWKAIPENGLHLSWEKWRSHIEKSPHSIKFAESEHSLLDYRYHSHKDFADNIWLKRENQFGAIGRLLLGLLCGNHDAPIEWNIRGNERVLDIPRARVFRSLAISSPTLLLIEGCIDPRSAESRLIARLPDLFGLEDGGSANDMQYDPPLLKDVNDLVDAIRNAQDTLSQNQLTVSMHQPRQLIPFRISDFAVSANGDSEEDADD